jgi:hypothetical protein
LSQPRNIPTFDDILAQCLDDVLRGDETIDDCLKRFPEYADELKLALQIALLTSRLKSPELAEGKIDLLEARLRSQFAAQKPRNIIHLPLIPLAISRMAAAIAIVVLLAFGSGAGLVAASADSLPGDTLYGIKRLWEAIVLVILSLTDQFDDFTLHLAEVRLDEVKRLDERARLNESALVDLYSATAKAISSADSQSEQDAVVRYLEQAQSSLETITVPAEAMIVFRDVVNLMTPVYRLDGKLQPPASELPPSLSVPAMPASTATATLTPTATATATASPMATATDEPTSTPSDVPTRRPSSTRRIPPTPTRTPSPSPTITPTPTLTVTPTSSWTPLPIPTVPTLFAPTRVSPQPGAGGSTPIPGNQNSATAQVRETQQSVYLTQTAGPPAATSTSTP